MRAAFVALLLLFPFVAFASDGDPASVTPPAQTTNAGAPTCLKLCDTKTSATDCGPIWAPIQNASHVTIKVESAINGGSAATFDDWGVYEMRTNTTPSAVTQTFGALCAIDDDTTTNVTGATAGSECKIFGPVGPFVFIDAGTLGTTTNFTVVGCWYPTQH